MKKSTKISIIMVGIGFLAFVLGIVVSFYEIGNGKWTTFANELIGDFEGIDINCSDNFFIKKSYGNEIDRIIVNIDSENIKYKESKDDNVYVKFKGNNISVSQQSNILRIGEKNDDEFYDSDSYVSMDENGIYVEDGKSTVSIGSNGISIKDGNDKVSMSWFDFNIFSDDDEVILYLPKNYDGEVLDNNIDD